MVRGLVRALCPHCGTLTADRSYMSGARRLTRGLIVAIHGTPSRTRLARLRSAVGGPAKQTDRLESLRNTKLVRSRPHRAPARPRLYERETSSRYRPTSPHRLVA